MNNRSWYYIKLLLAAYLCFFGCDNNDRIYEVNGPSIVPGVGIKTKTGDGTLYLGETTETTREAMGHAQATEDLGNPGILLSYPSHHLSVLFSGTEGSSTLTAIYLHEGVDIKTKGGVGIGSDEAEVREEFNDPTIDPFLNAWWYRNAGIVFQFKNGKVTRIQIFRP